VVRAPNSYYRISKGAGAPLRIGLLLDSRRQIPAYVARVVEDIQASNFAKIECLIVRKTDGGSVPDPASDSRTFSFLRYILDPKLRKRLLYELYLCLDARMRPTDDPLANVDGRSLLSGIVAIEVESSADRGAADAVEKIRSKDLDVLIQLGISDLDSIILKAARYGVWNYHHGDPEFYRGGPAYLWELREGSPLSGVVLRAVSKESGDWLVLCRSLFATERTLSLSRNRYIPYWGSSNLIIRKLNELHQFGWEHVRRKAIPSAPYKGKRDVYTTPTNRDMLPWLGQIFLKKALAFPLRRKTVKHWRIAVRIGGRTPLYDSKSESDLSDFRWIDAPKGHFWADPFAFEHEEKCWAFFENYSYRERRGSIACSEVSSQGDLGEPRICLDHASHHYSYPHVFRAESEIFMVPESFDSNSVDLFRCQRFPDQWVREATLLEGKFVDTTIWEHEGLWWLATTSAQPFPGAGCLLLFYSASLTGEWQFHPANPISTDIRQMRCAGRVFRTDNRLIRPSQNGAPDYGYSITFNEITELSKEQYSERPLRTIVPNHWPGVAGVHTYNRAGNIEFIDGRSPMRLKRVSISDRERKQ
jgi:hypothetical protein